MGRVETIGGITIHQGDCLYVLKTLPDNSVNCCVTSPPYYGLRDYGVNGQIGLEAAPGEYVARLIDAFREVRRVLRDDGTLWVNLGDSYATQAGKGNNVPQSKWKANSYPVGAPHRSLDLGVRTKNLLGIPWRVAFAMQADGWYLRQDIIWHKTNPMPESVKDRCTKAHEYVFLLSKSERYFFDSEAIKEPAAQSSIERAKYGYKHAFKNQFAGSPSDARHQDGKQYDAGAFASDKRNRRSVWTVATRPYKGAHFATFPPALIEPCILAGCPVGGTVLDPFGGSGTTGAVAVSLDRNAVLVELNGEYIDLAMERVKKSARLAADAARKRESVLTLPGLTTPKPQQQSITGPRP